MNQSTILQNDQSKDQGQALVEFSLVILLLLALFLGAFEVFNLYKQRTDVETATRRAVRQAAESHVDEANSETNITEYVYEQMEDMGYDRSYLEANVLVEIYGYTYLTSTQALTVSTPVIHHCVYGDYINVSVSKPFENTVIPLDTLFDVSNINRIYTAEQINRCWRGS